MGSARLVLHRQHKASVTVGKAHRVRATGDLKLYGGARLVQVWAARHGGSGRNRFAALNRQKSVLVEPYVQHYLVS